MCKDNEETQCPAWAKLGYCSKNPSYMAKNCALSCGKCGKTPFVMKALFLKNVTK